MAAAFLSAVLMAASASGIQPSCSTKPRVMSSAGWMSFCSFSSKMPSTVICPSAASVRRSSSASSVATPMVMPSTKT